MPANQQQRFAGALVFSEQSVGELDVSAEMPDVRARDVRVRLGADHLDLSKHVVDERPSSGHALQSTQTRTGRDFFSQRGTDAEPARQHQTDLCPTKSPWNGADPFDASLRSGPVRGPRSESRVRQLIDWRRHAKELKKL